MDNLLFVSSKQDVASDHMAYNLIEKFGFEETSEKFESNPVYKRENIKIIQTLRKLLYLKEPKFNPRAYIFLSCHRSESEIPTLTAHFPGNFSDKPSFGGKPLELGYTCPSLHHTYLRQIKKLQNRVSEYKIVTEPMHHGPTSFSRPVLFVEIGSSKEQWQDQNAIEAACEALIKTVDNYHSTKKPSIGFGGTHYSEKFTNLILETDYSLGAIMPKYALQYLNKYVLSQMITKSIEKISHAVLDWKGLKDKKKILTLIEEYGLDLVKI